MAKRPKTATAGKRKRDPIESDQLQRARELQRMNARERKIRRMFGALEREMRKTDLAARVFYERLGERFAREQA